jgi:hypothetical protein
MAIWNLAIGGRVGSEEFRVAWLASKTRRKIMKRMTVLLILIGFILVSSSVYAEKYEVGADIAVKVEYFRFMDSNLRDAGAKDGVYVGLEAYKQLFIPNLFFGVEAGWAGTSGSFDSSPINDILVFHVDTDVNYVPIEFNAKYVFNISPCLFFDIGGGFSINYLNIKVESLGVSASDNDWLWGGQFFGELNYKITPCLFVGVGVKYQLTEDMRLFGANTETSADNFRVGAQLGYKF